MSGELSWRGGGLEVLDLPDKSIECLHRKRTGLGVDQRSFVEGHYGRDRGDPSCCSEVLLGLCIDFAEHHIGVLVGCRFEGGPEGATGSTPRSQKSTRTRSFDAMVSSKLDVANAAVGT